MRKSILHLSVFLLAFLMGACSGSQESLDSNYNNGQGAISFSLTWNSQDQAASLYSAVASGDVCVDYAIDTINATVSNSDGSSVASASWPCSAHQGTISNVPVGDNRMVVIVVKDDGGDIIYQGTRTGISVKAGQTNSVGEIVLSSFVPVISGISVGDQQLTINLGSVIGATTYNVYWSTSTGVSKTANSGVFSSITSTAYTHTGLTNGTAYYYVVTAVNSYGESSESGEISAKPEAAPSVSDVFVCNNDDASISIVNGVTGATIRTITLPAEARPFGIAFLPDYSKAYVTDNANGKIYVIGSNSLLATINTLSTSNGGIAMHPTGNFAYIGSSAGVLLLDTNPLSATVNTITGTVSPDGFTNFIVFNPDGSRAYITIDGSYGDVSQVKVIDTSSHSVIHTIQLPIPTAPQGLAASPDGKRIYVTGWVANNVSVIDSDSSSPTYHTVTSVISAAGSARSIAITPSGDLAYVALDTGGVDVIDTAPASSQFHQVVAHISTAGPFGGAHGIATSLDGRFTYVTVGDTGQNKIYVIDSDSSSSTFNTVVRTDTVGYVPFGVAVKPHSVVVISDYSVSTTGQPFRLTVAADGGMVYFTESNASMIGSFNTASNTLSREYATGQPSLDIQWNSVSGNVYFTVDINGSGMYGILEPSTDSVNTYPSGLEVASAVDCNVDPDGMFWFNGWDSQRLVSVTGSTISNVDTLPDFGYTSGLAIDSDGNKWLTIVGAYESSPSLVKMTASGQFSTIPLSGVTQATIRGPVAAFDNIWFCNSVYDNGYTSQATIDAYDIASGTFDQFDIPTPNSGCAAIADDGQGRIWFAAPNANQIGVLTPETREILMYDVPTANSGVTDIAIDKDRRVIWFTETTSNKIGKLVF